MRDGPQGWKSYLACLQDSRNAVSPQPLKANHIAAKNALRADMIRLYRMGKLGIRSDFQEKYKFSNADHVAMLANFEGMDLANCIIKLCNMGIDLDKVNSIKEKGSKKRTKDFKDIEEVMYVDKGDGLTEKQRIVNKALEEQERYDSAKRTRDAIRKKGTVISSSSMSQEEKEYYNSILKPNKDPIVPEGDNRIVHHKNQLV